MDITKEPPAVLSLCTGYGGIERGLERAIGKINVLAHVEIEAFAIKNLVDKMDAGEMGAAPVWTDLKTLPVGPFRDRVDILTGGYPCQPFSSAGARKGAEDPRHLWPYILDIIKEVRPGMCFFENVEGHVSLGLSAVISDLEENGYRTTWGIFSASEVGAPHQRKRVFILAVREGVAQTKGWSDGQQSAEWERWKMPRGRSEKELAHTGLLGQKIKKQQATGVKQCGWPARPNEPQYEWEEPRVV